MKQLAALLLLASGNAAAQEPSSMPGLFGLPACQGEEAEFADRRYFALCHDSALRVPRWTAHTVHPESLDGNAPRPRHFRADLALAKPSARNSDYRSSGFARGHLVPAEDLAWSTASVRSTFLLSNTAPQHPVVNLGAWRRIENSVRRLARNSDSAHAFTGPIFAAGTIDFIGSVAVPTHFFKVVLAVKGGEKRMYAVIVPNSPVCAASFAVTVDEVERQTGLDFFAALEDAEEASLESSNLPLPHTARRKPCVSNPR